MFGLLPKNLEFFDCFDDAARNAQQAAELLAELSLADSQRRRELVGVIVETEHNGDRITHETLDRLEKTYLTPIDRDDIHRLIGKIDDVVDAVDAVAQRMGFYKIETVTSDFQDQCRVLVEAATSMAAAVAALRQLKRRKNESNGPRIERLIIAVKEAEERGDSIHHRFLGELFNGRFDPFEVIKWKELYETVEQAIDTCDDVANIVHGIVLKNV